VIVLAVVAISTAWSGFQGTEWGGQQALLYGQASSTRFEAEAAATAAGQQLVADSAIFTAWLQAHDQRDEDLESLLAGRFSPAFADAFDAWLQLDPFTNPDAPPGPAAMPSYTNPGFEEAAELNAQASRDFSAGTEARETSNRYIRTTVLFASVLFLAGIAQRFRVRGVRIAANILALTVLVFTLSEVLRLPRI